jgi:hypothetical protein
MSVSAVQVWPGVEESLLLLDLVEKMVQAKDLRGLAEPFLKGIATLSKAPAAVLFFRKTALPMERFFQVGLAPAAARYSCRSVPPRPSRPQRPWPPPHMIRPGCIFTPFPGRTAPWGCWESSRKPGPLQIPA